MSASADPNQPLSFMQLMQQLQQGLTVHELTTALRDVTNLVTKTGKPGKVTLEISIDVVKSAGNAITIKAEVKDKAPQFPIPQDMFFVSDDMNFYRNNPKQRELFGPRAVDSSPPANVDPETGEIRATN